MQIDATFYVVGRVATPFVFSMALNYFETIEEVKEKVQNLHGIPISHQNFIVNSHILQDHLRVYQCLILPGPSHILLQVIEPPPMYDPFLPMMPPMYDPSLPVMPPLHDPSLPVMPPSNIRKFEKMILLVKIPDYFETPIPLEMELGDTVLNLKKRILEFIKMYHVDVPSRDKMELRTQWGVLMLDSQVLRACGLSSDNNNREIWAFFKKSSFAVSGELKLMVLPKTKPDDTGIEPIVIEVNPQDKVSVLKQKLELNPQFGLTQNHSYFFIHNGNYLFEGDSFQNQHVKDGDTIETRC